LARRADGWAAHWAAVGGQNNSTDILLS
jgi:hypothetical protein